MARLTKKVRYRRIDIKQLVKRLDPKPDRPVEYEFSNGRVFRGKP